MTRQKSTQTSDLDQHAPEGMNLSPQEEAEARKEGAKEDVKKTAEASHKFLTDGGYPGDPAPTPYLGHDESQMYAYLLDESVDQFERIVAGKADFKPDDTQVYGLLNLERNGRNRTPFVRAMMKRLGLSKDELPGGGPSYTNDLTSISEL
jgi:hypothetical protein